MAIRFDGRNVRAETWLTEHSSALITEIITDQREAIRAELLVGMEAGENPRQTALGIVGRLNRATGKREGGIIGLTSRQAEYVRNAKAELRDPDLTAGYFDRKLRDKRYDRTVAKAMREGRGVSADEARTIAGRYAERLLAHRGEMIARTETLSALHHAQNEAMQQLIDTGSVRADQVFKTWSATGDKRTRDSHMAMNGQKHRFDQAFITPSGALMRFPQDASLGAGPEEIIGCRCTMTVRVKYLPD